MSYLKVTKNNTNYKFSLMPANDTTSKLFPAVKTVKVSTSNTLSFGNINYVSGRTYYVTVKFRTRGDGDSTSSKCSSVGFIANRSDWQNSYSYIHDSATAYAERGQIVEWTFEFTATANESRATALYFIINNYWGNGYDNQTIDLFYYRMVDSQGNVYAESSVNVNLLTKWADGTSLATEKQLTESTFTEKSNVKYATGNHYILEFDCKLTSDEVNKGNFSLQFSTSFNYSRTWVDSIAKNNLDYSYKHFYSIVNYYSGNDFLPNDKIRFSFYFSNSGHSVYIKNITLKSYYFKPMFLKIMKNNICYFLRLFDYNPLYAQSSDSPHQLKITDIYGIYHDEYYLAQNATEYKYNELASRTYQNLYEKFAY